MYLFGQKWVWLHFGRFFHTLFWLPWLEAEAAYLMSVPQKKKILRGQL
jgi:hypothetical protein